MSYLSCRRKNTLEVFTARKPDIKHLRIFGCICYSHVPAALRQKLDSKAEKGVFMGYGSCEKGYRVYILESKKIVLSRSVVFVENQFWNWKENQLSPILQPPVLEDSE